MKRAAFRSEPPPRKDRSAEFASFTPKPRTGVRMATAHDTYLPSTAVPKTPERKNQAIRDSARGEPCELRLPGCDGGGETTVWCHLPEAVAGRGLGLKGIDLLGACGCRSCHDIVDRRSPRPARMTEHDVALVFYRAMARSIVKLRQKGLV